MGRKLSFALLLALAGAAGCASIEKLPPGYGNPGVWPDVPCAGGQDAADLLIQIYSKAAQAAHTDPYKTMVQGEVLRIIVLPDDPALNAERCTHVEQAATLATNGKWLECLVELDQCN